MRRQGLLWLGVVALLVLAARWLTYALAGAEPAHDPVRGFRRRAHRSSS